MHRIFITLLICFSFPSFAASKHTVYVYAASSMTQVVQDLATKAAKQNIEVKGVFGSSSSIARQIARGAPVDIFISANNQWMSYLEKQKLGIASPDIIASNQLVVITAKKQPHQFELTNSVDWQDMMGNGRVALGETSTVPVGIYAKQALSSLGIWPLISKHIAPMKNTRAVLAMVEREQVPIGIVYATDARLSSKVSIVASIPSHYYDPILYPMILLSQKPQALTVYQLMKDPSMQQTLSELGFSDVEGSHVIH
ncbi:molybdate ABC transporter substrate-binding protein [Vibrio sp. UCD-FRSSP16_10]|uniref:molybdate ABC transporter substrate-binding protein n=1 Tax=unclassified Vibrio TaxID=2614977 RepID=UPI0007FD302D|nr:MULTISPECIES: molybdate ABC transporter substrate-binding protein [unclassified Vibrio]OBT07972.1 molybdate ABC transporter substrate-binding protein [Vibrio sp. UCD-FRSSP16_30]OBT17147.1 molybdate ABC transporter substrate-binding protein [Vibrio sp. UCD-FRSSP16_10]